MNYYGTSYNGYNPYNNYAQQQNQVQQFPIQQQQVGLNGKIVDSEDMVKATEVPIGGYGIFPKADLSEIFVKTWNNNGTTAIVRYAAAPSKPSELTADAAIIERLDTLEKKIDNLSSSNQDIYPVK